MFMKNYSIKKSLSMKDNKCLIKKVNVKKIINKITMMMKIKIQTIKNQKDKRKNKRENLRKNK